LFVILPQNDTIMKKIILAAALMIGCSMYQKAEAQISFSLGLNIGSQPDWGPVGYDHASYYYMPDVDAYYDVPNHQYVYYSSNRWVRASVLPSRYNFDPYNSYKVVINERNPWERANVYRTRYATYKGRRQVIIRDSREAKYNKHWQDRNRYDSRDDRRGPGNSDYGHDKEAHGRGNDRGNNGNGHGGGNGKGHGKH
jgi:hypothetical protein